ncbi:MAG: GGDEF domain-containing protein [Roseburia sp.]|nr:GGDEF domain-containing protein [Roseburia sp.]
MKHKIMMLTSIWKSEFVCRVTSGVHRRLQRDNYDLYIFNAYDMRGNENCFMQEHRIYKLPDISDFDGIIIAINSVGTEHMVRDIVERCRVLNKHIFCIDQKFEGACFAGIDNYASMYQMVEHMIQVHGCKIFNYLGGPELHDENKQRYQAFCDCLEKYHLEIAPERVSHRGFLLSDGRRAYQDWKKKNLHLPDVVICANDEMALGYSLTAQEDGLRAPEDYKITGFDNMEDGQNNFPSISSIQRNWEELGYRSADILMESIQGRQKLQDIYISGGCVLNESCGCMAGVRNARRAFTQLYQEMKGKEVEEENQRSVRQLLCECEDEQELQERLIFSCDFLKISEVAICINQYQDGEEGIRDFASRVRVLSGGVSEEIDTHRQLVPTKWLEAEDSQIYLFGSLYCGRNASGYCVMHYEPDFLANRMHKTFLESIGLSLDSILRRKELNESNIKLSKLYIQDSLTGLYNRFGYKQEGTRFFQAHKGAVYMAFLDVDGLKNINDIYGHAIGDLAICGVAEAMREVFKEGQVLVRMGGDEFLVIGAMTEDVDFEEKQQRIGLYLEHYSEEKRLPLLLQASMGFVWNDTDDDNMELLVQKADNQMYLIKQQRKREKKRKKEPETIKEE